MSDKKKGNKIDTKISRLDALQAAYVMGWRSQSRWCC